MNALEVAKVPKDLRGHASVQRLAELADKKGRAEQRAKSALQELADSAVPNALMSTVVVQTGAFAAGIIEGYVAEDGRVMGMHGGTLAGFGIGLAGGFMGSPRMIELATGLVAPEAYRAGKAIIDGWQNPAE